MPKVKLPLTTTDNPSIEICTISAFWDAVRAGDVNAIDTLYFTDEHLALQNADGLTALHVAIIEQKEGMVRWLLLQGCPLEGHAVYGLTALHFAAQRPSLNILRYLLLAGIQGLVFDNAGWTPLHIAVSKGFLSHIPLLTRSFPELLDHADQQGWTPLHLAASNQSLEIVKVLVKEGANLEALNCYQETPLAIASKYPRQAEVTLWLSETQQRQQQLKLFLTQKDMINALERRCEQLEDEVMEQRKLIVTQHARIQELEQNATTLHDKVAHRLTLFKANMPLFQNSHDQVEAVNDNLAQNETNTRDMPFIEENHGDETADSIHFSL